MTQITFDKLAYVDRLKAGGVSAEQARIHAEALDDAMKDSVVTKLDLKEELEPIKRDMAVMKWSIALILAVIILPLLKQIFA